MIIIKVEQRGKILARNSAIFLSPGNAFASETIPNHLSTYCCARLSETHNDDGGSIFFAPSQHRSKRANIGVIENADFASDKRPLTIHKATTKCHGVVLHPPFHRVSRNETFRQSFANLARPCQFEQHPNRRSSNKLPI